MQAPTHTRGHLFEQLGLPADSGAIEAFLDSHSLPPDMRLADAPFWTKPQADFLARELADDADWAELIDSLDARLRH